MKHSIVYKILIRTICVEYYRLNAGFFFIIIAFAFGLLRPVEHIALATYIVHAPFLLALLFLLWTLYTLKTVQFTIRCFRAEENLFLHQLYILPFPVKLTGFLLVQGILYEPIILYSLFMGYYALLFQQYNSVVYLLLFNATSIGVAAGYYLYRIKYFNPERKQSKLRRYLDRQFTKPYPAFFLYHVLHKQPLLFILTKTFSLFLLTGTLRLYVYENFSEVLLSLGALVAFTANAVLSFHFNRFEQLEVVIIKNLPIPLLERFSSNVLTYMGLLLPEVLQLMRHLAGDITGWMAVQMVLFGLSLPLIFHSYVLYRQLDLEKFIRHMFFITLFYFLLILFGVPVLLLSSLNIVAAYLTYRQYFYQAEIIILKEEPGE